jgi:transcriptional regulator with XRE-family HTH domain
VEMESQTAQLLKVLKSSISALGFTQKEVERRLDLSQGYLSRLFGGQIDLKVDHVVQIARVLQVDAEEIFRLAFPSSQLEPTLQTRRLQETFGVNAPEPTPAALSEIEKDIERIVQRVLERRGS